MPGKQKEASVTKTEASKRLVKRAFETATRRSDSLSSPTHHGHPDPTRSLGLDGLGGGNGDDGGGSFAAADDD